MFNLRRASVLALLAAQMQVNAQMLLSYDLSPNWTATDIQGNQHTLFDYLDQGYTVIIDFSTTWCQPCQVFHYSHTLADLYDLYGPGTAENKVMVFLIESDATTDLADLYGNGGQGTLDWVTGTPYPIIDDASVALLYGVYGYPTVYTICPSRMISTFGYIADVAFMWQQAQVCAHHEVVSTHDATLLGQHTVEPDCRFPEDAPLHTIIYNIGTAPLTSAAVEAVNSDTHEVMATAQWTGSIPTYGTADVIFPQWDSPLGTVSNYFRLTTPDDDAANDSTADEFFYRASPPALGNTVTIEVQTDDHGQDLAWRLERNAGALVDRRDPGDYANNTTYTHTYDLEDGTCYRFVINSQVTGEIAAPGYFRLRSNGDIFITENECEHSLPGGTSFFDQAYFTANMSAAVPDHELGTAVLSPNPAQDAVRISGISINAQITVFNALGERMLTGSTSGTSTTLDVHSLAAGVYVLVVAEDRGISSQQLVIQR